MLHRDSTSQITVKSCYLLACKYIYLGYLIFYLMFYLNILIELFSINIHIIFSPHFLSTFMNILLYSYVNISLKLFSFENVKINIIFIALYVVHKTLKFSILSVLNIFQVVTLFKYCKILFTDETLIYCTFFKSYGGYGKSNEYYKTKALLWMRI